jgi:hypothetical protein
MLDAVGATRKGVEDACYIIRVFNVQRPIIVLKKVIHGTRQKRPRGRISV